MKSTSGERAPLVPAGSARIGPICSIPGLLADFGANAAEVLSQVGLAPDIFDDPDRVIDYRDAGLLLATSVATTGCAHFGLLVGQRCSMAGLGLVGSVARAAADVGAALLTIVRYLPLFDRGSVLTLRAADEDATVVFGILTAGMPGADQLYDVAITVAFNTLRDLCGSCWRPSLVTLPHKALADVRPLRTYYGTEVRFDQPEAAIIFDRFWLERTLAASTEAERLRRWTA